VLANDVLIGGCAKIVVGNTDVVVHAHQAHRVKGGNNRLLETSRVVVLCREKAATGVGDRTAE